MHTLFIERHGVYLFAQGYHIVSYLSQLFCLTQKLKYQNMLKIINTSRSIFRLVIIANKNFEPISILYAQDILKVEPLH